MTLRRRFVMLVSFGLVSLMLASIVAVGSAQTPAHRVIVKAARLLDVKSAKSAAIKRLSLRMAKLLASAPPRARTLRVQRSWNCRTPPCFPA